MVAVDVRVEGGVAVVRDVGVLLEGDWLIQTGARKFQEPPKISAEEGGADSAADTDATCVDKQLCAAVTLGGSTAATCANKQLCAVVVLGCVEQCPFKFDHLRFLPKLTFAL